MLERASFGKYKIQPVIRHGVPVEFYRVSPREMAEKTAAMKEFIIEPDILPEVPEVNCRFETLSGLIEVCYKADGDRVDYRFRIPPNTVAVVRLPGEPEFRLTSGLHTGTCKAPRAVKASA